MFPGVRPVFSVVGPPLLHVGLLALTVVLVRAGTLAWWSPALGRDHVPVRGVHSRRVGGLPY